MTTGTGVAQAADDLPPKQPLVYVDGQTDADATADLPNGRRGSGQLQIGRGRTGAGWGEYPHGDVDEVHAFFAGALTDRNVVSLGS
jgi:hypothetical protein